MNIKDFNEDQLKKYIQEKIANNYLRKLEMEKGLEYYNYKHDIRNKHRLTIGEKGKLDVITVLPNSRITDNQYSRAVDQKTNYLFSEIPLIEAEEEKAQKILVNFFDKRFLRTLNKIAKDSYNCGIGWLYIYTDGSEIKYKKIDPLDVVPIWTDKTHDKLEAIIYKHNTEVLEDERLKPVTKYYFYTDEGVQIFRLNKGELEFEKKEYYMEHNGVGYSFGKIPFIYFKQPNELPLLNRVKALQDALNVLISNYVDRMLEDTGSSILVIKNHDGADLGEFRRNLAQYRAVKVDTADGYDGGVESLHIEVNNENYKVIIELLRKAISQNARSLYLDNEKNSQSPNELNLKSMYSDMELDANALELEFTASFEYMYSFIGQIKNINLGNVKTTLKRNIMVNEEATIMNIRNSVGIVSQETLRSIHPYVEDPDEETKRVKAEEELELNYFDSYRGVKFNEEE